MSGMGVGQDKNITNLYDFILDRCIGNVIMGFATGSATQAWDNLLTLYDVLDDNIKEECKGLIDEVETHITIELRKRGYAASDALFRRMYLENYISNYKHVLFDKVIRLLKKHGYLQRSWNPINKDDFKGLEDEDKHED